MHYYQFNIGDYKSHTEHLSEMEDLAYRRLLDWYYLHETPIPLDIAETARQIRMRSHTDCIATVLQEYFIRTDDGWTHGRADKEIAKTGEKSAKASESAKKRWDKEAKAMRTHSESNATHNTLHITQDTLDMSPAKLPTCPTGLVIQSYHDHLPTLPTVRLQSEARTKAVSTFWKWVLTSKRADGTPRAETAEQALQWIGEYFNRANDNDFLMGRNAQSGKHANWKADFDFLLTEKGKRHVIEKTGG